MQILILSDEEKKITQLQQMIKQIFPEAEIFDKLSSMAFMDSLNANRPFLKKYKTRFVGKIGNSIKSFPLKDIAYFFTENKTNFICTNDGKRFPIDFTLDETAQMLDPTSFFRINRQFIVGHHAIEEMKAHSRSRIILKLLPPSKLNTTVAIGRAHHFRSWLSE